MFKEIPDLLSGEEVETLRRIAAGTQFIDGRGSNPDSTVKNNLQAYDKAAADLMARALYTHPGFDDFAFPIILAPPMLSRYVPGMAYGNHADAAFLPVGQKPIRCDLSCTIFLSDPASFEGGALRIQLGTAEMRFRGAPGSAIVYPSSMLHEVEPVTRGERLAGITFVQSRIADQARRELLYELNEIAALEGLSMSPENYARLQLVQRNLLHRWGDMP
ncbi:MAG: Fe2+-dependent dioxygenase [Alphaproteobacteria bacterium]|nr:Fe2+-dependent dioxygenase [Alphaproteobacteria bacterium]MBV9370446.1 Fe2+-dependent dioxygenase [Alphaproteobacteria bacterium]MBV9900044.1 Fe2+-dependent dioxygenase [Alphaproteobacteria bacterium]